MDNKLHIHNDIEEAAKYYSIPISLWVRSDVYIMQEDRCVFMGSMKGARLFYEINEGKYCKSRFPLKKTKRTD